MSRSKFEAGEASQHDEVVRIESSWEEHEVVEIESSWVKEVLGNIKRSQQRKHPAKPSIFRIPQHLRLGHEHAYEPKLVSIGPYHHGNPRLQAMEEIKWQILHHLSEASKDNIPRCLKKMQDSEAEARSYYSEVINMESRRFVEMLLLDGYFVIQLFMPPWSMAKEFRDLFENRIYFGGLVLQDLLLLENQLPYFIVNDLLSVLNIQEGASVAIQRQIPEILRHNFQGLFGFSLSMEPKEYYGMAHLLLLLHDSNPEPFGPRSLDAESPVGVPSVTELVEAGVKIKVREVYNFLDISFNKKNGLLEIPTIDVQDRTNLIFRNLIALEQCYMDVGMKITCYSIFMDSIIDTEKDVALLRQEGIIGDRCANDKDIARRFNELCKDVVLDPQNNYLAPLFKDVNDYCNSRWDRWRARLMRDYFSNPWASLSVIAAAVLLVLTIVQTVFAVLSYTQQIHSGGKPHPKIRSLSDDLRSPQSAISK